MTEPTRPGEPPARHHYPREPADGRDAPSPRPTFTPRSAAPRPPGPRRRDDDRPPGPRHRDDDRPRPTFTPREGYFPPPDARNRAAYPPPEMYMPAPGIPQDYTQPFNFPAELSRLDGPAREAPGEWRPPPSGDSRTRAEATEATEATGRPPARAEAQPNLARASQAIALGTLVSRGSGFLRTFVLLYALGTGALADAYNNSNALPQTSTTCSLAGSSPAWWCRCWSRRPRTTRTRARRTPSGSSPLAWSRCSPSR
ncbi:MAG TPA: hypothetical protein VMG38_05030 [Trebonia sp.]|nr:hypothetical protein [Trebonia sp.]